ncbi:MAG: aspartate carbamoyltransferase catalytic subunit [Desulfovibrio sp.]|jgi:aspartate carbamoyltransferase catalytic subunit|nr:aspartate carbamoyltransferase catalytic subunit [Desulfovibrio sp.]
MNADNRYLWPHKDLLDVTQLNGEETLHLLDLAARFQEINRRPVKKVPILKGKTVVLFFVEDSTRTKTSFDVAAKRLSADTHPLSKSGSSLNKGETLKDTALTLQAMGPDVIVMRHPSSGAAEYLARVLDCSIVNGGDGWHAHPTQALLDCFSLRQAWEGRFAGRTLLILGDIAHSRVARSNVHLLTMLGTRVRLCAPRTLLPAGVENWPVEVYSDSDQAVRGVDAVMCLRLQLERQQAGLLPDLAEYSRRFCLTASHLKLAKPEAKVLHPGPLNRGLEIASDVADAPASLVLDQVSSGVATRMAILYLLATRRDGEALNTFQMAARKGKT